MDLVPRTRVGGVYRHYKGGEYVVISRAIESTNGRERKPVVVYVSLALGNICVRDEDEFHHEIITMRGNMPRFALLDWER